MNFGRTISSQPIDFIPIYEFHKCVEIYKGNYTVKSFSCWDQYLCMAFAQLTYRESLRDIEACLRAAGQKLYQWVFVAKYRTIHGKCQSDEGFRIYADFAQTL